MGDSALDLIDRMLTVDADKRITVDECLQHSWLTGKHPNASDSTDGLTGAMGQLDFSKRKMERERTLLSSINDVHFSEHMEPSGPPVKIFHKNQTGKKVNSQPANASQQNQPAPKGNGNAKDFANLGEDGDPLLYDDEPTSRYR